MRWQLLFSAVSVLPAQLQAAKPWSHGWGTVSELMGMHGKYKDLVAPPEADIQFAANHYKGMITTGSGCPRHWNASIGTIEDSVQHVATRIKAANAEAVVGMYVRTPFALELSTCSRFMDVWNAHPEWRLKDDKGKLIERGDGVYFIDYSNTEAADFFASMILNITSSLLPNGKPVLDYIYLDGSGGCDVGPNGECETRTYHKGIGLARSAAITAAKYAMMTTIQAKMDARGLGQGLVLNGMDNLPTAAAHVATGCPASMFDHWSILQFIDEETGSFNVTAMEQGFQMVLSRTLANVTTQIKGWVGPIVHQKDQWPASAPAPTTTTGLAKAAAERFNSELALFLLVATEFDFWTYSWFWDWYNYVPGSAESTVPAEFYPQAQCKLGKPSGLMKRQTRSHASYTREFEHASVFVDLLNRTNCKVTFTSC